MAKGTRFTKSERELIRLGVLGLPSQGMRVAQLRARDSVIAKLDASEEPVAPKEKAFTLREAIEAFQSVLGQRLTTPPNPPVSWYIIQQRRLNMLGIGAPECCVIAAEAGQQWTGRIKAESLVNQGASLLADAEQRAATQGTPSSLGSDPADLDMDEL